MDRPWKVFLKDVDEPLFAEYIQVRNNCLYSFTKKYHTYTTRWGNEIHKPQWITRDVYPICNIKSFHYLGDDIQGNF